MDNALICDIIYHTVNILPMRTNVYLYTMCARLKFLRGYKLIIVYGQKCCGACENVKALLNKRNILFEYIDILQLSEIDYTNIMNMAQEAGMRSMPIIMINGKIVTLSDVLN